MIDPKAIQAFSDKHCRGKVARLDLLVDMCRALGVRLTCVRIENEGGRNGQA